MVAAIQPLDKGSSVSGALDAQKEEPLPKDIPLPPAGSNSSDELFQVGGHVSAPVPIFEPEAEFSDEARRAKYQGVCLVALIVDAQGIPQSVRVMRGLGRGLDEKAVEAVRKYRFKPAMLNGRTPVSVPVNVQVNFRLY
jgi:protein TonB